ncbi:MAG: ComEC family competence protein [Candidatus Omnitrophica bacterium]|nr:ComEC family competence protein [Candidatus Omnitrophota bacterium]MCB9719891.1 ComEC family competence protein [Candidatus Omnitrophota bacterium]
MRPRGPALLWLTGAFMAGIMLNGHVTLPHVISTIVAAGLLLSLKTIRDRGRARAFLIGVLCLCAGVIHTRAHQNLAADHIVRHAKSLGYRPLTVEGVVVSEVRRRELVNTVKTSFTLKMERVMADGSKRAVRGRVLVNLFAPVDVIYGDRLRLTGKLHRPFEFSANDNFSYRQYLQNKGVHYILSVKRGNPVTVTGTDGRYRWRALFLETRRRLIGYLKGYLTENETGIMQAVLLGERSAIPPHVRELFVRTGTAHVLAVSGLHVGIVALLVMTGLQLLRLPRGWQYVLTMVLIMMYVLLTGARPSTVRAAVMSVVFVGSLIREREANALAMLSCAALLILLNNPLNLYDIGFQLSFACILAMITIGRRLERAIEPLAERREWKGWRRRLLRAVIISFAVWIGVEGLVMYHFNLITPVSVLANLFVIPLITAVVLLGTGLLGTALCWPWLAAQAAVCLKAALSLMVAVTFLCAHLPGAYIYIRPIGLPELALYYVIIGMIFGIPWGIIGSKFNLFQLWSKN